MNPEYKEISYHQLMKKIEVLNELNTDQKWFYNKLSEERSGNIFSKDQMEKTGKWEADKDKKIAEAKARYFKIYKIPNATEDQFLAAKQKLDIEIANIQSTPHPDEETDTPYQKMFKNELSRGTTTPSASTSEATTPPSGGTGALGAKKTSIWKKIGNTLASTARSGLRSTQLGSAIEKNFLKPEKNRSSGSRGSASDCNSIKLNSSGLGKAKQNQILKAAGCAEIP